MRGRNFSRIRTALRVAAVFSIVWICVPRAATAGLLDDVAAAWRQRGAKVRTARFKWSENTIISKGAYTGQVRVGNEWPVTPDHDLHFNTSDFEIAIDGAKVSYHTYTFDYDTDKPKGGYRRSVYAFNGKEYRSFSSARAEVLPEGIIRNSGKFGDLENANLLPVLLAYRALDEGGLEFSLDRFSQLPGEHALDGARCIALEEPPSSDSSGEMRTMWLDPANGFAVRRLQQHFNDKPDRPRRLWMQLDVRYSHDDQFGEVPSGWKLVFLNRKEEITSSVEAAVDEHAFNEEIPREEFDLPFPFGTLVVDQRDGTTWIQREGADRRIVTAAEQRSDASYEEFLKTESGELEKRRPDGGISLSLVLAAIGGVGLLLALFLVIRSRRRK